MARPTANCCMCTVIARGFADRKSFRPRDLPGICASRSIAGAAFYLLGTRGSGSRAPEHIYSHRGPAASGKINPSSGSCPSCSNGNGLGTIVGFGPLMQIATSTTARKTPVAADCGVIVRSCSSPRDGPRIWWRVPGDLHFLGVISLGRPDPFIWVGSG